MIECHEVETMAYTNEVPWHGLGKSFPKPPKVKEMLKGAGLDWGVELRDIYMPGVDVPIKIAKALVRDKDNHVLDVVGPSYVPTQNAEAFDFFNEFVNAGGAHMETAGALRGGKFVWGLANLKQQFEVVKGDTIKGYLLVICPHQQGKSLIIKLTTIRVVCMNTLRLAMRGGQEFRMVHRHKFDKAMQNTAKETLGIARETVDKFADDARRLKKIKMSEDRVKAAVTNVFGEVDRVVAKVMDCYKNAPGADVGTAWGALNAVTYYVDHIASRTADKRLTNAWMGKGDRAKREMFEALLVRGD